MAEPKYVNVNLVAKPMPDGMTWFFYDLRLDGNNVLVFTGQKVPSYQAQIEKQNLVSAHDAGGAHFSYAPMAP